MKDFIVISCFTRNTPYESAAMRLLDSLDELHIPHHIEGYDSLGTWHLNCRYKATFIKDMLIAFPDKNIVFLDADAAVHRPMNMFRYLEVDVAVYYYDNTQLCSGTLFLQNNERVNDIVGYWIRACAINITSPEQKLLQNLIERSKVITLLKLPPQYCKINGLMEYVEDPIVQHFQLSRTERCKKEVK